MGVAPAQPTKLPAACLGLLLLAGCARESPEPAARWVEAPTDAPVTVRSTASDAAPAAQPGHAPAGDAIPIGPSPAPRARGTVDREAARAAARTVSGVTSVVWVDEHNLLALVDRNGRRSHQAIDEICYQLARLGDVAGIVVHLQSTAARGPQQLEILGRDCGLPPGERMPGAEALQLDALDPAVRAEYELGKRTLQASPPRAPDAGDRRAIDAIPEL